MKIGSVTFTMRARGQECVASLLQFTSRWTSDTEDTAGLFGTHAQEFIDCRDLYS